jgi:23S rRNA pseudouridine1911/1915/1917 synthase
VNAAEATSTTTRLVVPAGASGRRLDAFLAEALVHRSRSRVKALVDDGRVQVDGRAARASSKLKGGEAIVVDEPAPAPTTLLAQDLPLAIVHEDDDLVVLDKPAGLVVHPGAGHASGTLANALAHHRPGIQVGGALRPGIVHRLDKDTSGLLVVAKNERAHRRLGDAFRARDVVKRYVAFTIGVPRKRAFALQTGHRRHPVERRRFTTKVPADAPGARVARSAFVVVAGAHGVAEIEVDLQTGRTHQIRAHLADHGFPLLHDALYGGGKPAARLAPSPVRDAVARLTRHALHARDLAFPHPTTGATLSFTSPLPDDLRAVADAIRRSGG